MTVIPSSVWAVMDNTNPDGLVTIYGTFLTYKRAFEAWQYYRTFNDKLEIVKYEVSVDV